MAFLTGLICNLILAGLLCELVAQLLRRGRIPPEESQHVTALVVWAFITLGGTGCSLKFLGWLLLVIELAMYAWKLMQREWLRKEWSDFLGQFSSSGSTVCSICIDDVPMTEWHVAVLPCCKRSLCWSCVRKHAEGVIDDGRREMLCPFGTCGANVPDVTVRTAFRREQWLWQSLDVLGYRRRQKCRMYDLWVLRSGLAASCSARVEDVLHCPNDECNHMWVIPRELRRKKTSAEPQSWWNPKGWSVARHLGLYDAPRQDGRDARRIVCPKCNLEYCHICFRQWHDTARGLAHDGKSCAEHQRWMPVKRDQGKHKDEAIWAGAKSCPGCGIRVFRFMGCNHMTCTSCQSEWCWVCLSEWSTQHYSCRQEASHGICNMM